MKNDEDCINCTAKQVEEFCSKCNGDFYHTLLENICPSCYGSIESACRHIRQKGDYCIDDGARIRFLKNIGRELIRL